MCTNYSNLLDVPEEYLFLEKHRRDTYKIWPFKDTDKCCIQKMAEAGFYWTGNENDNDSVECFICQKALDGWESSDDPWEEHKKHAPQCAFVKLGKPEQEHTIEECINIFNSRVITMIRRNFDIKKKKLIAACEKRRIDLIKSFNISK